MDYQLIVSGTLELAVGLPRVVAPRRSLVLTRQDRTRRIAEIEAGAPERYFEEYRALQAYPVASSSRKWVIMGWLAVVIGLAAIVAGFMGKSAVLALLG